MDFCLQNLCLPRFHLYEITIKHRYDYAKQKWQETSRHIGYNPSVVVHFGWLEFGVGGMTLAVDGAMWSLGHSGDLYTLLSRETPRTIR